MVSSQERGNTVANAQTKTWEAASRLRRSACETLGGPEMLPTKSMVRDYPRSETATASMFWEGIKRSVNGCLVHNHNSSEIRPAVEWELT